MGVWDFNWGVVCVVLVSSVIFIKIGRKLGRLEGAQMVV